MNETAWRWEYLGEVTGTGGNVFTNIHDERLSLSRIRNFERTRNGVDWGWFPDPWRFVRCAWEPSARRLLIFEEHSANRKTPAETAQILLDAMTYADEDGEEPYFHDEIIWADDTPDGKQQMAVYRRDFRIRIRPARKARMRKISYEWLAGLREIVIDPFRCPKTYEEFTLKEYLRNADGTWGGRDSRRQRPFHRRSKVRDDGRCAARVISEPPFLRGSEWITAMRPFP